jgi:phospholipid N-methyltransferase
MVGRRSDNFVVEVGAGTGAITAALLRHCVSPDRLVAIERSPAMAKLLQQRFSGVRVIEGDACHLHDTLERQAGIDTHRITHIVSSLPLRSLPADQVERISKEFFKLLSHGSRLVQYTYNLRQGSVEMFSDLHRHDTSVVWLNVPPARVEVFAASGAPSAGTHGVFNGRHAASKFSLPPGAKAANASPRH